MKPQHDPISKPIIVVWAVQRQSSSSTASTQHTQNQRRQLSSAQKKTYNSFIGSEGWLQKKILLKHLVQFIPKLCLSFHQYNTKLLVDAITYLVTDGTITKSITWHPLRVRLMFNSDLFIIYSLCQINSDINFKVQ